MATDLLATEVVPVRFRKLSVKKKASMLYGEGVAAEQGEKSHTIVETNS
jgi:hypothetical protein